MYRKAAFFLLCLTLVGCGSKAPQSGSGSSSLVSSQPSDSEYRIGLDVSDSSDLPDWPGKQITLNYWCCHGTGGNRVVPRSKKDVVAPEITRVTGVTIDEDESFDNGGSDYNQKLALIVASDQWPNLIWNPPDADELARRDLVYDLTDYMPQYAPDLLEKIPLDKSAYPQIAGHVYPKSAPDRMYGIPFGLGRRFINLVYPELDTQFDRLYWNNIDGFRMPVYIREDVCLALHPEALSIEDLQEIYVERGEFTTDEIYDLPIRSAQDFYSFLRDVHALGQSGEFGSLFPTYAYSGQDNWALFGYWLPALYGCDPTFNYYTYYDHAAKEMRFGYESPVLKQMAYDINALVRDGILPMASLTDTLDQFNTKLSQGQYAVSYAWWKPANNPPYRYREAYFKIDVDFEKYALFSEMPEVTNSIYISKKSVKEEDIPQILQYVNYMVSDVGEKVQNWGPRSAGLFTEANGVRILAVPSLADELASTQPKTAFLDYGLYPLVNDLTLIDNFMRPAFISAKNLPGNSRFGPDYHYRKSLAERVPQDYSVAYNANLVDPYTNTRYARDPSFWNFVNDSCPLMNAAGKKRKLVEDAFMKTYMGLSDAQFEEAWRNYEHVCRDQVGYNDAAKKEMNDYFFNEYNADFADMLS
ncbi:MAG: extracellular solute-binding protein [Clostridiales bacterium]|nr:extracellular solute-binding protein [Clostridiales bacterium]